MRVYCEGEVTAQTDASESTCVLTGVNRSCFCSGQWAKLMSDFFFLEGSYVVSIFAT